MKRWGLLTAGLYAAAPVLLTIPVVQAGFPNATRTELVYSSLAEIQKVATITRENIGPITESLRGAATSAEAAASRAQQLMGSSPRQNYDLSELIKELTRAAEAVRALASYLGENPDALLKGRGKGK